VQVCTIFSAHMGQSSFLIIAVIEDGSRSGYRATNDE
jgi:hypothetical protein